MEENDPTEKLHEKILEEYSEIDRTDYDSEISSSVQDIQEDNTIEKMHQEHLTEFSKTKGLDVNQDVIEVQKPIVKASKAVKNTKRVFKKVKVDYYQEITNKVIEYIEENKNTPWEKPWKNVTVNNKNSFNYAVKPYNPVTGTIYKAMNELGLSMRVPKEELDKDPRFLTFKNIVDAGFQLKKGSRSKPVFFMAPVQVKDNSDRPNKIDKDDVKKIAFTSKEYKVFHASDIIGIPPYEVPPEFKVLPGKDFENIQKLVEHESLKVYSGGNRAFYKPSKDYIQMPNIEQFENKNAFYHTLMHEIGHWTMAEDRVYRPIGLDKQAYAKEELVAEMFSLTASRPFNILPSFEQSADYMKGWLTVLKNDKQFLFRATSYAERATNYCMELAGLTPILKLQPQIKINNTIDIDLIKFPFYGKSKEELKPYFEDLINGRKTEHIPDMISIKNGKPFTARAKLRNANGEIKASFTEFKNPKKKATVKKSKIKR